MAHNIALKSSLASLRSISLSTWSAGLTTPQLLQKSTDPYLALLACRSTPLPWCGFSPAQLLTGRNMQSTIPKVPSALNQSGHICLSFMRKMHWRSTNKRSTSICDTVPDHFLHWDPNRVCGSELMVEWTLDMWSYMVETSSGMVWYNQVHVTPRPTETNQTTTTSNNSEPLAVTCSRTGALVWTPTRLSYWRMGDVVDC